MTQAELPPHQQGPAGLEFPAHNVCDLLRRAAERDPHKEFIVFASTDARRTYAELYRACGAATLLLKSKGLGCGDRIALVLRNREEFVRLFFGALALGATVVPVNPDLSDREIAYIVRDSAPRLICFDPRLAARMEAVAALSACGERWAVAGPEDLEPDTPPAEWPWLTQDALRRAAGPADAAMVLYTSGTTGRPKGVVLTHLNFVADAMAIAERFHFDRGVRTLCMLPLFHNNGVVITMLTPLAAGGSTVITDPRSSLRSFWALVEEYGVTWTSVMPAMLAAIRAWCQPPRAHSLQGIICGGQVLSRELQDGFEAEFQVPIFEGFGLTETTAYACLNAHPAERRRVGSVGLPLSVNRMRIVDETGRDLPPHREGEIWVQGYNVAREYHALEALNAERFAQGWFHTGDYGYRDEDGHFYFLGRRDHLIIKGGENIYPAELENVLFMHPDVAEAAVIGIPHEILGQDLCAFVKLKDGTSATEAALAGFCQGKIAAFKQPQRVIIVDHLEDLKEIPKGPTKKVLYRELSRYYQERLG